MKDYGTDFTTNAEVKTTFILLTAADRPFDSVSALEFEFCAKIWYVFREKRGVNSSESIAAAAEVMI